MIVASVTALMVAVSSSRIVPVADLPSTAMFVVSSDSSIASAVVGTETVKAVTPAGTVIRPPDSVTLSLNVALP